ncbi:toxin-antitoxin system YwqK family antitoxin [Streptomyces longwoodensis]|uniref:toxin-antitoxin system YwqK family antitoxin n=1 Tax=Streptomyces longwoodensis TaxID=68231 RepID=UPI0030DECCD0
MQRVDIDSPEVFIDEQEVLHHRGHPFTGEAVEYQRGALVSLVTYEDGIENGPLLEWYTDGTPRSRGTMRGGFPVGEAHVWHPNGRLAARILMSDDGLRQLSRLEWDEEGNVKKEWHAEAG